MRGLEVNGVPLYLRQNSDILCLVKNNTFYLTENKKIVKRSKNISMIQLYIIFLVAVHKILGKNWQSLAVLCMADVICTSNNHINITSRRKVPGP